MFSLWCAGFSSEVHQTTARRGFKKGKVYDVRFQLINNTARAPERNLSPLFMQLNVLKDDRVLVPSSFMWAPGHPEEDSDGCLIYVGNRQKLRLERKAAREHKEVEIPARLVLEQGSVDFIIGFTHAGHYKLQFTVLDGYGAKVASEEYRFIVRAQPKRSMGWILLALFAHLAQLIKRMRNSLRHHNLLLLDRFQQCKTLSYVAKHIRCLLEFS